MMAQTSPFMDSFLVFKTFMAGNDISLNNLANNVPNFLIFFNPHFSDIYRSLQIK